MTSPDHDELSPEGREDISTALDAEYGEEVDNG